MVNPGRNANGPDANCSCTPVSIRSLACGGSSEGIGGNPGRPGTVQRVRSMQSWPCQSTRHTTHQKYGSPLAMSCGLTRLDRGKGTGRVPHRPAAARAVLDAPRTQRHVQSRPNRLARCTRQAQHKHRCGCAQRPASVGKLVRPCPPRLWPPSSSSSASSSAGQGRARTSLPA